MIPLPPHPLTRTVPLPPSTSVSLRHLGSSCLFAPLYAHALIALILLFSLCGQAQLGTPTLDVLRRARRRLHRTGIVVTALDLAALRRLREHHGSQPPRMAWTCVCCHTENAAYRRKCGNSECRFPGGPPEAWEEKHGKDKRRDKSYPPKHTWHCGECGVDNSSRRWSCSSCGAKPPGSGASSAAAQPKKRPVSLRRNFAEAVAQERRRVQAALPVESRSQPDSELTDVKVDEDLNQDRDKCNSKEVANKLKDLDTLIRQLQPCAKDDRVAALLEEKKQERDELKIQLQNHKPLHQRLRLATEARAKASKALEIAKKEEADIVELLALKRAEVDQFKATRLQHNNNVELLEQRYRTETGSADLGQFEIPGFQTMAPLSPSQWAAGFRNCLNSQAREVFDTFCKELEPRHRRAGAPVFAGTSVLVHNVDWCGRCAYSFSIRDER